MAVTLSSFTASKLHLYSVQLTVIGMYVVRSNIYSIATEEVNSQTKQFDFQIPGESV